MRLAESSEKSGLIIERELGIYQGAIHAWHKAMQEDPEEAFPGTGHLKSADDELRRLRRELKEVRQERDSKKCRNYPIVSPDII